MDYPPTMTAQVGSQATDDILLRLSLRPSNLTDWEYRIYSNELREMFLDLGESESTASHGDGPVDHVAEASSRNGSADNDARFCAKAKRKRLRTRDVRDWLEDRYRDELSRDVMEEVRSTHC